MGLTNSGTNTFTFCGSTPAELAYVHAVTSAIQTQLNNKLSSSGGTITGSISCTELTDYLGTGNALSNYLDIVIPTGSTNYTINVSNAFNGSSVAYQA